MGSIGKIICRWSPVSSPFKFEKDHRQMGEHFPHLSKSGAVTLGAFAQMKGYFSAHYLSPALIHPVNRRPQVGNFYLCLIGQVTQPFGNSGNR